MNRLKKHSRIKQEKVGASSSSSRGPEEHDLAYFIHDRVELMHQVFSVLKSKELKALAPECVRHLSISDLQELCLEELLGISSKRLCAIMDGAEPPSDTESSSQSPEHLETISLDSISSDDEILSQSSKKKKPKHKHGKKKRRRRSRESESDGRAARAGLTVLELLELQARARAIRAQLHQEPPKAPAQPHPSASDTDVEIKEEPADILEISSDDEPAEVKPETTTSNTKEAETNKKENRNEESQTVTKRINDLIITAPQSKPTRKIKLRRQKPTETRTTETSHKPVELETPKSNTDDTAKPNNINKEESTKTAPAAAVIKGKKTKKKKKKAKDKEGSDQDEITLQLSDTEKMDLLEDLEAKNFDKVSSSGSSSSVSSDSEDSDNNDKADKKKDTIREVNGINNKNDEATATEPSGETVEINPEEKSNKDIEMKDNASNGKDDIDNSDVITVIDDKVLLEEPVTNKEDDNINVDKQTHDKKCNESSTVTAEITVEKNNDDKKKSDGELSDRDSSEVEASDVQPEVVCISDDEGKKKKKKKKEKKSKRDKHRDRKIHIENSKNNDEIGNDVDKPVEIRVDDEDDDIYETLEISDDSSCYEVDGVSVLSKEPTAEEIEAFSVRMDEIEIERVETVIPNESDTKLSETSDVENISWRDRYLGSKKVQRVLTTSNVLNAIRKKNKELKRKLEEAKKAEKIAQELQDKEAESEVVVDNVTTVEDGSIEQYETLQASTKYVDPVKEKEIDSTATETKEDKQDVDTNATVTKAMKKDAKMLMKMYKRLLKYNDMNKQKDPNKKKKKKQKKSKDKDKEKVNS